MAHSTFAFKTHSAVKIHFLFLPLSLQTYTVRGLFARTQNTDKTVQPRSTDENGIFPPLFKLFFFFLFTTEHRWPNLSSDTKSVKIEEKVASTYFHSVRKVPPRLPP